MRLCVIGRSTAYGLEFAANNCGDEMMDNVFMVGPVGANPAISQKPPSTSYGLS